MSDVYQNVSLVSSTNVTVNFVNCWEAVSKLVPMFVIVRCNVFQNYYIHCLFAAQRTVPTASCSAVDGTYGVEAVRVGTKSAVYAEA